jgi:hypothetical protein
LEVSTSDPPSCGVVVFAEIWQTGAADAGYCQLRDVDAWAPVATVLVATTA